MSNLKLIEFSITYYKGVDGVRRDETDEQSVQLQQLLTSKPLAEVVAEVTDLDDQDLIAEILVHLNK